MSYDQSLLRPLSKYIRTSGRTSDQLRGSGEASQRDLHFPHIWCQWKDPRALLVWHFCHSVGISGRRDAKYDGHTSATAVGPWFRWCTPSKWCRRAWRYRTKPAPPTRNSNTARRLRPHTHLHNPQTLSRFGIVHVIVEAPGDAEQPSETYKALIGNLRPTLDNCLIHIELKKHPSRAAPLRRVRAFAKYHITVAKFDLMQQSGYHALRYEQEVMRPRTDLKLVAGSGDFWTFGTIPMKHRPKWDKENGR